MSKTVLDKRIISLIEQMQKLIQTAIIEYSEEVDQIIDTKITSHNQIENLLEKMLNFCHDDEMLHLFKKLCRYYYKINPQITAEYINIYREIWDDENEEESNR